VEAGALEGGKAADFFTVDLSDASIAGSLPDELLTNVVFSMSPRAVCDVVVDGMVVIEGSHHAMEGEIIEAFRRVQTRLGTEL
jgi:cytosine/adenosine deaminase-related metal-dependent hydrolase